jgi:hypothetical protein
MPEVEAPPVVESPAEAEVDTTSEPEEEATPAAEEAATLKQMQARLAGKDRAYTALKAEAEQQKQLVKELSTWKAEKEQADMTEVERYQQRITELEQAAAQAKTEAVKAKLEREFPLAFELLGDTAPLDDEGRLAEIEEKLKAKSESPEPRTDPNQPRRTPVTAKATGEKTDDELIAELQRMGNPFVDIGARVAADLPPR